MKNRKNSDQIQKKNHENLKNNYERIELLIKHSHIITEIFLKILAIFEKVLYNFYKHFRLNLGKFWAIFFKFSEQI